MDEFKMLMLELTVCLYKCLEYFLVYMKISSKDNRFVLLYNVHR